MSAVSDSMSTERGRDTRHFAVYLCLALAYLAFWIGGSRLFYGDYTSMFSDVAGWFGSLFTLDLSGVLDFGPLLTLVFFLGLAARVFVWENSEGKREFSGSLVTDQTFRGIFFEILLFTALAVFIWWIVGNTVQNLIKSNIASGFGFLETTAGFGIIQSLVEYSEESTYGRAFVVGLLNTIFVAIIGIFFATIIGFLAGIMRLSKNWIISKIATVYVEVMRNIPLLLQILVWYALLLEAVPDKRGRISFFGLFDLNVTGLWMPAAIPESGFWLTAVAFVIGIVAAFFMRKWAIARQFATGEQFPILWTALGLIIGLPLLVFLVSGMPLTIEFPKFVEEGPMLRRGFQNGIGWVLIPEFLALLFALSIYTGAFIAEIVRAGILAVSHGQTEAASALGLKRGHTLRLVVIPQALRVIIPPLTSQYLNLTKNSSLAVAIAYPDLVAVGGIVLNQSGQALEIIGMWLLIYLSLSLLTSLFMNWYNAKMALVER